MLYYRKISKNKCLEVSSRNDFKGNVFDLSCYIDRTKSHAGFHFLIAIFTWMFEFNIYDIRHWDYENNCWEVYIESDSDSDSIPGVKKASVDEHENNMGIGGGL